MTERGDTLGRNRLFLAFTYQRFTFGGRNNYVHYSALAHVAEIVSHPEKAHEPQIAARILAAYIVANRHAILSALAKSDFRAARAVVNGHLALHFDLLEKSYRKGQTALRAAQVSSPPASIS